MSQANRCEKAQSISNPGGLARHIQACDTCGSEGAAGDAENGGYRASDVRLEEIAEAVRHADADALDATLALHEHTPADGDTRETAAAKALIQAKSGGRAAYVEVFGECSHDGCEYGRNGLRASTCKGHEGEAAKSGDSEPETPDPEPSPEPESEGTDTDAMPDHAKLVAELVKNQGLSPATAENAASYVRELVDAGLSPGEAGEAAAERFA